MALKAADASARREPLRAASGAIAWVTPAADASKSQIAANDAAVKRRGVSGGAANPNTRTALVASRCDRARCDPIEAGGL
jgi:hypothetical protein